MLQDITSDLILQFRPSAPDCAFDRAPTWRLAPGMTRALA